MSLHDTRINSTVVSRTTPVIYLHNYPVVAEEARMDSKGNKLKSPSRLKPLLLGRGLPSFSTSLQEHTAVLQEPSRSLDQSLSSSSSTSTGNSSVLAGSCSTSTSSSTPALSCSSSLSSNFSNSTPARPHIEPTCPDRNRNRKVSNVDEKNSRNSPPRRSTIEDDNFNFGGLQRNVPTTIRKFTANDGKKNFVDNLASPTTSGTGSQRLELNVLEARAKWRERNKEDLIAKREEEEKEKKLFEKWKEWQLQEAEKENRRMRRSQRDQPKKFERVKSEEDRRKSSIPMERKWRPKPGFSATSRAPPPAFDTASTGRIKSKISVDKL